MIWTRPELRVLFVCTANVCRSPLAEGLLRHRLRAMGLAGRVLVGSAGSCAGQRGRRPDPRVEKLAAAAGFSLGRIRSRVLTTRMIQLSDYVLVMEHCHLEDIAALYAGSPGASVDVLNKNLPDNVHLLGAFLPQRKVAGNEIPDPYFGDWQGFVDTYDLIDEAVAGFALMIEERLSPLPSGSPAD